MMIKEELTEHQLVGIPYETRVHIARLVQNSKRLYEQANGRGVDDEVYKSQMNRSRNLAGDVEQLAMKYGYKVSWPGLFPLFSRDGRDYQYRDLGIV